MVLRIIISILVTKVIVLICAQSQNGFCVTLTGGKGRCLHTDGSESPINQLLSIQTNYQHLCGNVTNCTVCCPLSENIVTPESSKSIEKCLEYTINTWSILGNQESLPAFKSFIVGGEESLAKEFPHMAALGFADDDDVQWQCGGSLISEQFVLTAAHCTFSKEIGELRRVRLGILNLRDTADHTHLQEFYVAQIFRHPEYEPPSLYNDIAIVRLDRHVQITDYVRPACLHTQYNVPDSDLIAIGWGRVQYAGSTSDQLQKVSISLYPNDLCREAYISVPSRQLANGIVDNIQICAGGIGEEKDTCQGDSGGPLQIIDPYNSNLHHIVGITSFGKGCGVTSKPGVYTRVYYYVSWIEEIVWPD